MAEPIERISRELETDAIETGGISQRINFTGNVFEDVLSKSIEALNGVSRSEFYANQMIDKYVAGEVDMADAMIAASKMSVMVQLAVTVVNSAVTTFKEVTQMQI
jgi:flagellar hook-basal body complex protein FliE